MLAVVIQLIQKAIATIEARMDVALSTRASQTSVDAIPTTGAIKAVQRGTYTMTGTTTTITISPVVLSKSFVLVNYHQTSSASTPDEFFVRAVLSSTSIAMKRADSNGSIELSWQVIEYY